METEWNEGGGGTLTTDSDEKRGEEEMMVRAWDGMLNIRAGNKVASFIYYEGNKLRRRT